jgi:hypothetical protein
MAARSWRVACAASIAWTLFGQHGRAVRQSAARQFASRKSTPQASPGLRSRLCCWLRSGMCLGCAWAALCDSHGLRLAAPQSSPLPTHSLSHSPSRLSSRISAPSSRLPALVLAATCKDRSSHLPPLANRLRSPVAPAHASGSAARASSPTSLFLSG